MKNFINTIRKTGPLRSKDHFSINASMVNTNGELSLWDLMQILNTVKGRRMNQLLIHPALKEKVTIMDLKIHRNAALGEELIVESSFTPNGKRTVDLKVYVSRRMKGTPTRRVCKAVFTLYIHQDLTSSHS